ncbi:MAG: glycosyltransferase family 9 protein [Ignavibacteriae bacterium]|nr:glycosyltransferase family 9 protein [Ignavibacteriota bacterium]
MNFSKVKNILIVRLSSLGDILLTTPLIRSLKNSNPNIKIDFVVRKEFKDTVLHNPHLNNIYQVTRDQNYSELRDQLSKTEYDVVIDLQNNLRSRSLTKKISKNIFRFKKPNIDKFLLVNFKLNLFKKIISIPERYANSLPNFNLDEESLELFLPNEIKSDIEQSTNIIGLCPGSVHKTKMWLEEYFVELGNLLVQNNYKVFLFGGKSDREICKSISNQIEQSIDLSNDNKLFELSANMRMCKTIVCNDSGLMHTAVANNVPVVAVFGSTVKEFGFTPYKNKSLVIEKNELTCRPCSHIGLGECPKKHFECMKKLTPQLVFEKTINFIESL